MSLLSSLAIEQRLRAIRYANWARINASPAEPTGDPQIDWDITQELRAFASTALTILPKGDTFFVRKGPIEIIMSEALSLDLNKLTSHQDLMIAPSGFMYLEHSPLKLSGLMYNNLTIPNAEINALAWHWSLAQFRDPETNKISETKTGLMLVGFQDFPDGAFEPKLRVFFDEGDSLSKNAPTINAAHRNMSLVSAFAIAASAFMRQKIVSITPEKIHRQTAKRIQKEGWEGSLLIRDIQLREVEKKAREVAGVTESDYSCRWWVRRHWRLQPYSATGKIVPILIDAHLKGPQDKPIKPHRTPIFVVSR